VGEQTDCWSQPGGLSRVSITQVEHTGGCSMAVNPHGASGFAEAHPSLGLGDGVNSGRKRAGLLSAVTQQKAPLGARAVERVQTPTGA